MGVPKLSFQVAFLSNPGDDPLEWTTVPGTMAVEYQRGAPNEYGQMETGLSTVDLGDAASALDLNNVGVLANYCRNPRFGTDTATWIPFASSGSTVALSRVEALPFKSARGDVIDTAARMTATMAAAGSLVLYKNSPTTDGVAVTAGDVIYVHGAVRCASGIAPGLIALQVRLFNATGGYFGAATVASKASPSVGPWYELEGTYVVPAGNTAYVEAQVLVNSPTAGATVVDATAFSVAPVSAFDFADGAGFYVDGDVANSRWSGTPEESQSYYGAPYYPNVKRGKAVRTLLAVDADAATNLTTSGNEITDALRALGVQGDGLLDDSSFGVWSASENRCKNSNLTTNASGWFGTSVGRVATVVKFGTHSLKVTTAGGANDGCSYGSGTSDYTPGETVTFSVWVLGTAGKVMNLQVNELDGSNTFLRFTQGPNVVLTGAPQRLVYTVTLGASTMRAQFYVTNALAQTHTFWVNGCQIEPGSIATPLIATDGAIVTRAAARVQAPAALLDAVQGWVALRLRMGWDAGQTFPGGNWPEFFAWSDDAFTRIMLAYVPEAQRFQVNRSAAGDIVQAELGPVQAFKAGDEVTVVMTWDDGLARLSVDGSTFDDVTSPFEGGVAATLFDIGSDGLGGGCDSDVRWMACGTGTLTDADAKWLHDRGGAGPSGPSDVNTWRGDAVCTAVMPFDTAAYSVPTVRSVFQHFIERLPRTSSVASVWSQRTITSVDAFGSFALAGLKGKSYPVQASGARWNAVLTDCSWAAGRRNIDAGNSTLDAISFGDTDSTKGLTHLLDVVSSENGFGFMDADGDARFIARHAQITDTALVATFADGRSMATGDYPGALPYVDLQPESTDVFNDYTGSRAAGAVEAVSDATSIDEYGPRSQELTFLVNTDAEVIDALHWRLSQTKDPYERIDGITVMPGDDGARWEVLTSLEIGDRILVVEWPPGFAAPVEVEFLIRHLDVKLPAELAASTFTFQLTPATTDAWLVLDDATAGRLDSNKPGY